MLFLLFACSDDVSVDVDDDTVLFLEETGPPVVRALDLSSGETELVYAVPDYGFAYELDVSSTGEVVLAWTPPPEDGEEGYDRSRIVRVVDGDVEDVACADVADQWCFYPTWSADGDSVWFVDIPPDDDQYVLSRADLQTGQIEAVVPWATEPAVSAEHVVWVAVDPQTAARSLVLGDVDATELRTLVDADDVYDIGQPVFSADGTEVYFVVLDEPVATFWDWILPSAHAHDGHGGPGDWWRVSIDGGEPERITSLHTTQYDATVSSDGRTLYAASAAGVVGVDLATGDAESAFAARTIRAVGLVR